MLNGIRRICHSESGSATGRVPLSMRTNCQDGVIMKRCCTAAAWQKLRISFYQLRPNVFFLHWENRRPVTHSVPTRPTRKVFRNIGSWPIMWRLRVAFGKVWLDQFRPSRSSAFSGRVRSHPALRSQQRAGVDGGRSDQRMTLILCAFGLEESAFAANRHHK